MKRLTLITVLLLSVAAPSAAPDTSWLQWGGPRRNFTVETSGLASKWPASGPKKLWERALGEGHSSASMSCPSAKS